MGAWSYAPAKRTELRRRSAWQRRAKADLLAHFPGARWLGDFADRPVRGGAALSTHAVGRAVDIAPRDVAQGDAIAAGVIAAWPTVQLILWNGRQWGGRSGPGWRPFRGKSGPHRDHLHIESRSTE